eukprot:UN04224
MEPEFVRMKANIKVDKALVHVTLVDELNNNNTDNNNNTSTNNISDQKDDNNQSVENKKEKQQNFNVNTTDNDTSKVNKKQIVTLDVDTIQAIFNLWNNNTWYETRIDNLTVTTPKQQQQEEGNNNNNDIIKPTTFNCAFELGNEFISPQINYLNKINLKIINLMNFINLIKAAQLGPTILPGLEKFVFPYNFKQIIDKHINLNLSEENTDDNNNNNIQKQQNKDESNSNDKKEKNQSYQPQTKNEHHAKHTIKHVSFNTSDI